jgi:phosphocarrier protein
MFEATAVVKNEAGIHCRPSAILVKEGMDYPGEILVSAPSGTSTLTSALELIMLGLEQGTEVSIQVSGPDEEAFGKKLVALFETHFDFPQQQ